VEPPPTSPVESNRGSTLCFHHSSLLSPLSKLLIAIPDPVQDVLLPLANTICGVWPSGSEHSPSVVDAEPDTEVALSANPIADPDTCKLHRKQGWSAVNMLIVLTLEVELLAHWFQKKY